MVKLLKVVLSLVRQITPCDPDILPFPYRQTKTAIWVGESVQNRMTDEVVNKQSILFTYTNNSYKVKFLKYSKEGESRREGGKTKDEISVFEDKDTLT